MDFNLNFESESLVEPEDTLNYAADARRQRRQYPAASATQRWQNTIGLAMDSTSFETHVKLNLLHEAQLLDEGKMRVSAVQYREVVQSNKAVKEAVKNAVHAQSEWVSMSDKERKAVRRPWLEEGPGILGTRHQVLLVKDRLAQAVSHGKLGFSYNSLIEKSRSQLLLSSIMDSKASTPPKEDDNLQDLQLQGGNEQVLKETESSDVGIPKSVEMVQEEANKPERQTSSTSLSLMPEVSLRGSSKMAWREAASKHLRRLPLLPGARGESPVLKEPLSTTEISLNGPDDVGNLNHLSDKGDFLYDGRFRRSSFPEVKLLHPPLISRGSDGSVLPTFTSSMSTISSRTSETQSSDLRLCQRESSDSKLVYLPSLGIQRPQERSELDIYGLHDVKVNNPRTLQSLDHRCQTSSLNIGPTALTSYVGPLSTASLQLPTGVQIDGSLNNMGDQNILRGKPLEMNQQLTETSQHRRQLYPFSSMPALAR